MKIEKITIFLKNRVNNPIEFQNDISEVYIGETYLKVTIKDDGYLYVYRYNHKSIEHFIEEYSE